MKINLRAIDLFCGAGGSSYGAQKAGAEIVAGFDIWQPAINTFRANFPDAKGYHCDLTKIEPLTIKCEIGSIDLILASPECTNHSNAKGDRTRSEESKMTAFQVVKFARVFRPKWIVIENVVEMEVWNRQEDLKDALEELDFSVVPHRFNAKYFGVPQSRERLFLICSSLGEINIPQPNIDECKPASTIIDQTGKYKFTHLRKPGRAKATLDRAEKAIQTIGENKEFLIVYYGSGRKSNGGWQRISEPLRTVTTLDRFGYVIPTSEGHMMRMLQPEELKLAMGFDKGFDLDFNNASITRRDRIKLMGNGVCPPVMETIVSHLLSSVEQ